MSDQMADGGLIDIADIDLRQLVDADAPELMSALDLVLARQPAVAHHQFNARI